MSGSLLWGYYPTDKIWIPIKVSSDGTLQTSGGAVGALDDLTDVSVPSPTDGYVLYWDAATSLWKAKAIPSGAWADITGKPTAPSLEELATEHEADGTHGAITPTSCGLMTTHEALTTGVHAFNKTCRLWNNATQSIPTATATAITFNTEKWDTDTMHSTVSNTHLITCKTAGKYLVVAAIEFAQSATGQRELYIYKNDTELQIYAIEWSPQAGNSQLLTAFCFLDLAVNDTIQIKAYQTSGGSLNSIVNNPYTPQLAVSRLP